ncbi:MAG: hypothetical protein ABI397_01090 [Candidatus Saccharimonas sp.]
MAEDSEHKNEQDHTEKFNPVEDSDTEVRDHADTDRDVSSATKQSPEEDSEGPDTTSDDTSSTDETADTIDGDQSDSDKESPTESSDQFDPYKALAPEKDDRSDPAESSDSGASETDALVDEPKVVESRSVEASKIDLDLHDSRPVEQLVPSDGTTLTLQWLTYVFWLWFSFAIIWLTGTVFSYFALGSGADGNWTATVSHPIVAAVVLFLAASISDRLYAKREPMRKTGAAAVTATINTVIYALAVVCMLVFMLFMFIQLATAGSGSHSDTKVSIYVSIVAILLYLTLVARSTMVAKFKKLPLIMTIAFGVLTIALAVAGIFGPMAQSDAVKQDQSAVTSLADIADSLSQYVLKHNKLPKALNDSDFKANLDSGSIDMVNKGVITYTPNVRPAQPDQAGGTVMLYYELCATYNQQIGEPEYNSMYSADPNVYNSYLSIDSHPAGKQCYKMEAYPADTSSMKVQTTVNDNSKAGNGTDK